MLNYDLAPRPAIIFGCLLPAPWLGVLAGVMLAIAPGEGLPHRFSPLVLSLTHILALGMLAPVMIGALFQLFPVVGGQAVRLSRYIAPFLALGSSAIALSLSYAFYYHSSFSFSLAFGLAAVLFSAVVIALFDAGMAMRLPPHRDASLLTLRAIALPLFSLVSFGLGLLASLLGWWTIDLLSVLRLHVAWALIGWLACLILGVATTVFPMFWQCPRPAPVWHRFTPVPIWTGLLLYSATGSDSLQTVILTVVLVFVCGLLCFALRHVLKAKRRFDAAWPLWLLCVTSGLLAALLSLLCMHATSVLPEPVVNSMPWMIGALVLVGGGVCAVNAMLGKIIPFLVFLHLRRTIPMGQRIPSMQLILPPKYLKWQAHLLMLSLMSLLLLPMLPSLFRIAGGILFAISQAFLAVLLLKCLFQFRQHLRIYLLGTVKT